MIRCFSGSALVVFLFVAPEPGQCCSGEWAQKLRKNVQCMIGRRRGRNSALRLVPLRVFLRGYKQQSYSHIHTLLCQIVHDVASFSDSMVVDDRAPCARHSVQECAMVCGQICQCVELFRQMSINQSQAPAYTWPLSYIMKMLLEAQNIRFDGTNWLPDNAVGLAVFPCANIYHRHT